MIVSIVDSLLVATTVRVDHHRPLDVGQDDLVRVAREHQVAQAMAGYIHAVS